MPADQMTMLDDLAEILRSGLAYDMPAEAIVKKMLTRLRNPTPEMLDAGHDVVISEELTAQLREQALRRFQAMLDKASGQ